MEIRAQHIRCVVTRFGSGGQAAGLLTLAFLSLAAALLPWALQAEPGIALSLSFVALGFPAAALRALRGDAPEVALPEKNGGAVDPVLPGFAPHQAGDVGHVAIVGAGFTGTMLAVQLLRQGAQRVTLIERRQQFARGLAYSSQGDQLLNVRASRMSAFPDDDGHFARWLARRGLGNADDFVPRKIYGQYLASLLSQTWLLAGDRLKLVRGEAIDVAKGRVSELILSDGRRIPAETVILALGNLPPQLPRGIPPGSAGSDPWSPDLAAGLSSENTVLLLGTGLTMIDAALQLAASGFKGKMIALSRRGLVPRAHADAAPHGSGGAPLAGLPISQMVRSVRRRSGIVGWRAAVDELRPFTHDIWRCASAEERNRFLRHLRPWWDVHRHRVAPALAERIKQLQADGRLEVVAGKIERAETARDLSSIFIRARGAEGIRKLSVIRIVNCTGPSGEIDRQDQPLLRNLARKGMIRPDRHRLGIDVDADGRVMGANGSPTSGLLAVGPIARGRLWEVTAVPDLRTEAAVMARFLASQSSDVAAEISAGLSTGHE